MGTKDVYKKTFVMAFITVIVFAVTLLNSSLNHSLVQWLLVMVTVLGVVSAWMTGLLAHRSQRAWSQAEVSVLYLGLFIGMLIATYFSLVYVWMHHGVG